VIVFIRTLPLTLALAALLAFPHFIGNTSDGGADLMDAVARLHAFTGGDLEALEGLELPSLEASSLKGTDWSSERYEEQWSPVLSSSLGLKQGDAGLAAILRATELPIDAHLARRDQR
jgi:hypothetical protein